MNYAYLIVSLVSNFWHNYFSITAKDYLKCLLINILAIFVCYAGKDEVGQVGLSNAYWFLPVFVHGDQTAVKNDHGYQK